MRSDPSKRKKYYALLRVSFLQAWFCVSLSFFSSFSRSLSLFVCVCVFMGCRSSSFVSPTGWGEDSRCRGGIVNIGRGGCSCARLATAQTSTALWRFRASTSNSLSGRSRLHAHTPTCHIYHTYARQDIRVCEDDHFSRPRGSSPIPRRFGFFV